MFNYIKSSSGAVLPVISLLMPVIIGVAGLGTDVSLWMYTQQNLQTAADAAAVAGAWEEARGNDEDTMQFNALKEAVNNGYNPDMDGEITVTYNDDEDTVDVVIEQNVPSYMTKVFTSEPTRIRVTAQALVQPGTDDFCILSLEQTELGSMTTSGSVVLDMPDCGIAVNSSSDYAFKVNGNVNIDVESISIVGGLSVSGGSGSVTYDTLSENAAAIPDPYANYTPTHGTTCNYNNTNISGGGTKTLNPGVYCGGLRIRGNNNVIMNPGVYTFMGGAVDIAGGGTLTGHGVSLVLTGSGSDYATLSITGNRVVDLSAPAAGQTNEGMLVWQDPSAPSSGENSILGTADILLDGVLYFPEQELNLGGNSTTHSNVCTKVIARTVILHGNPFIGTDCSTKPIQPITAPRVKLSA